jgi:recombination protein RecT
MSVTTAVARLREERNRKVTEVDRYMQSLVPEFQRALPKGMDADRLTRIALTVIRKDEKLQDCDKYSFVGALMTSAQLGLEPGVNGEAYLVPYGTECTLIVGYQGYAKLFFQHPLAKHLDAQAVREGDVEFDYAYGTDPYLRHKPAPANKGQITHYWAAASLTNGGSGFVVLTAEEVQEIRGGKVGPSGKIADPMHWMERKTAIRQLVKLMPKSATLARAIDADERTGSELRAGQETPKAIEGEQPKELAGGPAFDPDTGEVIDAELVDPKPAPWPDVTPPGGKK